jgi:predicted nucleotidyltransferase
MKLTLAILKLLIENKEKEFSIREISKLLKKNYKNTYDAIKIITPSIKINDKGNAKYISFIPKLTIDIWIVENERKKEIENFLKILCKDIYALKNPLITIILFGSYAKKIQTNHSDIDLCIIHDNNNEAKYTETVLTAHKKVETHCFTYIEFSQMLNSKKFNIAHEIYRTGIILKNIESYYNLIANERETPTRSGS